jgi:hypothetical protein
MCWLVGRQCINLQPLIVATCKFEFNAIFDGLPVKLTKEVCGGAVWMASEDNVGNSIVDSLQLSQVGFRDSVENRVAVVEAGLNKVNCDCFGSVVSEGVANLTKRTDVIEGGLSEMTVKGDVKSL